ncbi:MAG: hypothetical protein KatS3mg105_1785 [Gemmatales bacterium]|nr:MAG: hypothetical protein KatS3mg105_1785 [Gemmatales bacterium]
MALEGDANKFFHNRAVTIFRALSEEQYIAADDAELRRAHVDRKHMQIADLLQEQGCEGVLLLDPANIAWLTGGGTVMASFDPEQAPALFVTADQRWLICSNAATSWVFDREVNGLGFQLKEWPWQMGRGYLLRDICQGRVMASDLPFEDCKPLGHVLSCHRRRLGDYERACLQSLGKELASALEATCRNIQPNRSESEIAGQIADRLYQRNIEPKAISVLGDGRAEAYPFGGCTSETVQRHAVLWACGQKYGLHAACSRSFCFGAPEQLWRAEYDAACTMAGHYRFATRPNAAPREVLEKGKQALRDTPFEHVWRNVPPGYVTGRRPVEMTFRPNGSHLLQANWPIIWQASAGRAFVCDTLLLGNDRAEVVTVMDSWPFKRIRIEAEEYHVPYLLVR